MNRAGTLILALALTVTGCVELPKTAETKIPPAKEPKPAAVVVEPPAVLPEEVEDGNARQALDALRDELNRAAAQPAHAPNSDH